MITQLFSIHIYIYTYIHTNHHFCCWEIPSIISCLAALTLAFQPRFPRMNFSAFECSYIIKRISGRAWTSCGSKKPRGKSGRPSGSQSIGHVYSFPLLAWAAYGSLAYFPGSPWVACCQPKIETQTHPQRSLNMKCLQSGGLFCTRWSAVLGFDVRLVILFQGAQQFLQRSVSQDYCITSLSKSLQCLKKSLLDVACIAHE